MSQDKSHPLEQIAELHGKQHETTKNIHELLVLTRTPLSQNSRKILEDILTELQTVSERTRELNKVLLDEISENRSRGLRPTPGITGRGDSNR